MENVKPLVEKGEDEWFLFYTAPRAEKKVEERLKLRAFESFLPIHKVKRKWSDRVKIVEEPLYRGYIFVRCKKVEIYDLIKTIFGLISVVVHDKEPAFIKNKDIELIRQFLSKAEGEQIHSENIESKAELIDVDDTVRVISGTMSGYKGVVMSITKSRVVLVVDSIGKKFELHIDNVELEEK